MNQLPTPAATAEPHDRRGEGCLRPADFPRLAMGIGGDRRRPCDIVFSVRLRADLLAQRRHGFHGDLQRPCPQRRQAAAVLRSHRVHNHPVGEALVSAAARSRPARRLFAVSHSTGIQCRGIRCRHDQRRSRRACSRLADRDRLRADFRRPHSPRRARLARRADRHFCIRILRRHRRAFADFAQRACRGLSRHLCAA